MSASHSLNRVVSIAVRTLLVIGLLTSLVNYVMMHFGSCQRQLSGRKGAARTQLDVFKTGLSMFNIDTGTYPDQSNGLSALIRCPAGVPNWHGPYIDKNEVPLDPWGQPYIYQRLSASNDEISIISCGPDKKLGSDDDISIQLNAP